MKIFDFGHNLWKNGKNDEQGSKREKDAEKFGLAAQGGFVSIVKHAIFILLGYLNVRLFVTTVHGWEGVAIGAFGLGGEGMALYCLRNFTRSTGWHKAGLGFFAFTFTAFSLVYGVFSFFKLERNASTAPAVKYYCENVAFPLLFSLLALSAIVLPLLQWRARVAARQAEAQTEVEERRADLVAEATALKLREG